MKLVALVLVLVACDVPAPADPAAAHKARAADAIDHERYDVARVALAKARELGVDRETQALALRLDVEEAITRDTILDRARLEDALDELRAAGSELAPVLALRLAPTTVPPSTASSSPLWPLVVTSAQVQARTDDAVALLQRAAQQAPARPSLRRALARALVAENRLADAQPLLEALAHEPGAAEDHVALADLRLRNNDRDGAIAALRRANTLHEDALTLTQLATLVLPIDRTEAKALLTRAVALTPTAATTFSLAVLHQEDGLHSLAKPLLEQSLTLDPTAYAPAYHLAASIEKTGESGSRQALMRYLEASRGVASEATRRATVEQLLGLAPPPVGAPSPATAPVTTRSPNP